MIGHRGYVPQPGTVAARAIAWFATQPADRLVPTGVLADALEVDVRGLTNCLEGAVRGGVLARERVDGLWRWRRLATPREPEQTPDDDPDFREVRIVDAASAPPIVADGQPATWIPPLEGIAIERPAPSLAPAVASDDTPAAPRLGWREGRGARVVAPRAEPGAGGQVESDRPVEAAAAPPSDPPAPPPPAAHRPGSVTFDLELQRQRYAPAPTAEPNTATDMPRPFRCAMWSDGSLQFSRANGFDVHLDADETKALLDYLDRVLRTEAA